MNEFTCNICGARNGPIADLSNREQVNCPSCGSTIRFRSIILALSRALFGIDMILPDFPVLKSLRGLGISDSNVYSGRLDQLFSYTNTWYHKDPQFDLANPDAGEFGKYDFILCSEVMEHVPPPVGRAFQALADLLKPTGFLIMTTPYTVDERTVEHFEKLDEYGVAEINGKVVLVSRSADGKYDVFDQLTFHGGYGSTLEMRMFSQAELEGCLRGAGFTQIAFDTKGNRRFGVTFPEQWSLPMVARRSAWALNGGPTAELMKQWTLHRQLLEGVRESRWLRLGRRLGLGPDLEVPKRSPDSLE